MYMEDAIITSNQGYNLYNLEANFRTYLSAVINLKAVSIKNYLSDLRYFIGWYTKNAQHESFLISLENLSSEHIEAYKAYLLSNHLPTKTVNRRLSTVRMFGKYLISQNILKSNPAQHIVNTGTKAKRHPSTDQSEVSLSEFAHFLSAKEYSAEHISQAESDINEFLSIINS